MSLIVVHQNNDKRQEKRKKKPTLKKKNCPLGKPLASVLFREQNCINKIPGKQHFVMYLFPVESEDHIDPQIFDFV